MRAMKELNRRSVLRRASALAGAAALLPQGLAGAQEKSRQPDRKLRVVAVGGHLDDPQTCAGGTLTLYADLGHDVVGLSLTRISHTGSASRLGSVDQRDFRRPVSGSGRQRWASWRFCARSELEPAREGILGHFRTVLWQRSASLAAGKVTSSGT